MDVMDTQGETFCSNCGEEKIWLSSEIAAMFLELSELQIERLIESGEMHARRTHGGTCLVCLDSLYKTRQRSEEMVFEIDPGDLAEVAGL